MSRKHRNLSGPAQRQVCAFLFDALGDETRLALVSRLSSGTPRSISQLTDGSRLTRQAITKHLRVLEGAGLVHGVRSGRENLFALDRAALRRGREFLDAVSEQWDEALGRLKASVDA